MAMLLVGGILFHAWWEGNSLWTISLVAGLILATAVNTNLELRKK